MIKLMNQDKADAIEAKQIQIVQGFKKAGYDLKFSIRRNQKGYFVVIMQSFAREISASIHSFGSFVNKASALAYIAKMEAA